MTLTSVTPSPATLNWPTQAEVQAFYGIAGVIPGRLVALTPTYTLYYGAIPIHHIQIHQKCATSLERIFDAIHEHYRKASDGTPIGITRALARDGASAYSGSYALRKMVGGSHLSMHAYGCALDFDAEFNPRGKPGRFMTESPIVQAFEAEGWIWGGRWHGKDCDPMHFQAARVS